MAKGPFDDILNSPFLANVLQERSDILEAIEKQDTRAMIALADRHFSTMFHEMKGRLVPYAAQDFDVSATVLGAMIKGVKVSTSPDVNAKIEFTGKGKDLTAQITLYWGLMRFFHFSSRQGTPMTLGRGLFSPLPPAFAAVPQYFFLVIVVPLPLSEPDKRISHTSGSSVNV